MKIMICGKGGSGKSTLTVLLAQAMKRAGKRVLVVDADESNLCLHRLLGIPQPEVMMEAMGGRPGTRERLKQAREHDHQDEFFQQVMTFDDLPTDCVREAEGIRLLVVGKIREFGEGCACMIGSISKTVLARLQEKKDELVLIDAEAGLEHFGRQVDKGCDLALFVVDPSFESLQMADRARKIAEMAGVPTYYVLNKVDDSCRQPMRRQLDKERVIGSIARNEDLFLQSLGGEPLTAKMEGLEEIVEFLLAYRKPVTLGVV